MKKSEFQISSFLLILSLFCISINGNSQDQKLSKKENKEAREAKRLKDYETLGTLLENRKFAFITERVQGAYGTIIYNSIRVDESRIFVHCDDPKSYTGIASGVWDNTTPRIGLTGLYFEGDIENWELLKNSKDLSYTVKFHVIKTGTHSGGDSDFTFNINPNKSSGIEIKSRGGSMVYSNYTGLIGTL